MGLSAELVATTLVGVGLGWLVGDIGRDRCSWWWAGCSEVLRSEHGVPGVEEEALSGAARPAVGASWGIRRPGTRIFLQLPALLGYGACNPSGTTLNGRQGTW